MALKGRESGGFPLIPAILEALLPSQGQSPFDKIDQGQHGEGAIGILGETPIAPWQSSAVA
jgi:hypothetical protein